MGEALQRLTQLNCGESQTGKLGDKEDGVQRLLSKDRRRGAATLDGSWGSTGV